MGTLLEKKGFPIFDFHSMDQKPKIMQTFNAIKNNFDQKIIFVLKILENMVFLTQGDISL